MTVLKSVLLKNKKKEKNDIYKKISYINRIIRVLRGVNGSKVFFFLNYKIKLRKSVE